MPESFNVLVRELKGLGLDVQLLGGVENNMNENNKDENVEKKENNKENVK